MINKNWFYHKNFKIGLNVILVFLAFNFVNSIVKIGLDKLSSIIHFVYYIIHLLALIILVYNISSDIKSSNSWLKKIYRRIKGVAIPRLLKIITLIIFIGQLFYITIGETRYPFSYVGMFSWSVDFSDEPSQIHQPKYYYYEDGEPQIVEIRKQHIFFMADLLGWGYNNELTFSMNYHYKGEKENFKFLKQSLESKGIEK